MLSKKTLIILILFVIAPIKGITEEKITTYRNPTAKEMQVQFEARATEFMLNALTMTHFAAKINEALECPCYDIIVTTQPEATIIRIDNKKCEEIKK